MFFPTYLSLLLSSLVHVSPAHHRADALRYVLTRHHHSTKRKEAKRQGYPVLRASFTSNPMCGASTSCNAGTDSNYTGIGGIGAAAVNSMLFGGPPGAHDGSGGYSNVNGVGSSCGTCWTLTPGYDYYERTAFLLVRQWWSKLTMHAPTLAIAISAWSVRSTQGRSLTSNRAACSMDKFISICARRQESRRLSLVRLGLESQSVLHNTTLIVLALPNGQFGASTGTKLALPY